MMTSLDQSIVDTSTNVHALRAKLQQLRADRMGLFMKKMALAGRGTPAERHAADQALRDHDCSIEQTNEQLFAAEGALANSIDTSMKASGLPGYEPARAR